jgi:hypothetical protein
MSNSDSSSTCTIGLGTLLTVLFVALKLTHVIDWSWWWVLAPTWIPFVIGTGLFIIAFLFGVFAYFLSKGK